MEGSLGGTRALLAVFCAGLHLLDMSRGALQLPTHQHTGHRFLHAFKALIRYHLSSILVSHGMLSTGMSLQVTMKMWAGTNFRGTLLVQVPWWPHPVPLRSKHDLGTVARPHSATCIAHVHGSVEPHLVAALLREGMLSCSEHHDKGHRLNVLRHRSCS